MLSEEKEDVVMIPDVDAVFLLVAGGAEGGTRPGSFREEGVITQRASQSVVDPVVLVPQPEDLLLSVLDLIHTDSGCLFKVLTALLTAEERPDVPSHHLQHRSRLTLQT